jgi:hypothetical protein
MRHILFQVIDRATGEPCSPVYDEMLTDTIPDVGAAYLMADSVTEGKYAHTCPAWSTWFIDWTIVST